MTEKKTAAGRRMLSIRLSAESFRLLELIQRADGISRTAAIETAIRRYAESRGLRKPVTSDEE